MRRRARMRGASRSSGCFSAWSPSPRASRRGGWCGTRTGNPRINEPANGANTHMLVGFFLHLKSFRLPVSTREFLTLLEALDERVVSLSIDDFHTLARTCLVKDEQHFDRFDLAFGAYFKNVDALFDIRAGIP